MTRTTNFSKDINRRRMDQGRGQGGGVSSTSRHKPYRPYLLPMLDTHEQLSLEHMTADEIAALLGVLTSADAEDEPEND